MTSVDSNENQFDKQDQTQRITAVGAKVLTTVMYAYVVIVEIILGLGFVLLLFGANPGAGFVDWIYRSMDRAMKPFRGIFQPIELGVAGNDVASVFETSVLFAMIIYGIGALALASLLHWLASRISRIDQANYNRQLRQAEHDAEMAYRQAVLRSQSATYGAPAPTATPPTAAGSAASVQIPDPPVN